ncbi:MAG: hypothetical protein QXL29_01400 [Zestosphaera sp.]
MWARTSKPLKLMNVLVTLGFRDSRQTVRRGLKETLMNHPRKNYENLRRETISGVVLNASRGNTNSRPIQETKMK